MIHLHAYQQFLPLKEQYQDFDHFVEQVGLPPDTKHTLQNGKWVATNDKPKKRKRKAATINVNVRELSRQSGIPYHRIYQRLQYGWTVERAISTPVEGA